MRPAAALLLVLLLACSGSKTPAARLSAAPVPAPAAPSEPAPAVPAPAASPAPAAVPTPPPVPARPFDEAVLTGREFLLEAPAKPGAVVRDPVTGPWGSDPAVDRTAAAFLEGAARGAVEPALLEPRWSAYLTSWVKKNGPEIGAGTVRVGRPLPEKEGVVLVPVVVRSEGRTARGWLALTRTEGGWLVSDAEVNPDTAAPTLFDPEAADQLISSPSRR